MILARRDFDKTLESVHVTEHGMNSAKTFIARHAGIVWMASQFHLVFFRYRNDALEEVCDALPVLIGLDRPGLSQRWLLPGFIIFKGAV